MRTGLTCAFVCLSLFFSAAVFAEQPVVAKRITSAPQIDGHADESFWQQIAPVTVNDVVAKIPLQLKAAHDGEHLYFLVEFPDADESRLHRALVWKPELNSYQNGPTREDSFVLKWAMSGQDADLTLSSDRPYRADVWYWKAHRTDHAGYADDKIQHYTTSRSKKSLLLLSKSGKVFYLLRNGDKGSSAYKPKLQAAYTENQVAKYDLVEPGGSRADVRAKGYWQDGRWTIEFARKLQTGNDDDLQMNLDGQYLFGVSRYEIAGRQPEPETESDVPLFGSGEVGELLRLSFQP
ncbi:Ethylbenzene dehydrogenase [Malonomonas rubra DSM 5091]|uniref:Ethylbenzene dehydrogenase n=1 Tax=Malonomonas rubra DSM 5091 TaxID=1122189 RepID=A0A1M6LPD8_MALRU|nr:ethylbenzene dehydrogenase-related protein [Malonomonas rubra]SHJ73059.1 Ethylbenzene dehydrogenase [Malonomonas rubra DSM 5091]